MNPRALAPVSSGSMAFIPWGFDVNRKATEAQILRRARELATTGRNIGRHSIETKLRFEMAEPLALEILADQTFQTELNQICAEAAILRAKTRQAARADAAGTAEARRLKRRQPNADQKRALQAASLRVFMQQYGRKAQKRTEPNDRRYDWEIEQAVKRMDPMILDRLLRDDEED